MPGQAIPSVLYKYYPPERIYDVLDNYTVRFSSPDTFNDAFDTTSVSAAAGRTGAKGNASAWLQRRRLGIFCLTEDPDNHLMWVNYSAQHRGFVVGFNTHNEFFSESPPRLVTYVSNPVSLPFPEGAFFKSDDWKYEKEWRCLRQFDTASPSRNVAYELSSVSEVILGWHMEHYHISHILELVEMFTVSGVPIKVSQSLPDKTNWKFRHCPTDKAFCAACNGLGYITSKAAAQS
jgi:hypothetical protein